MIECNLLGTRTDGKKVYTRFSRAFINKNTIKFVSEIPEGADESDYPGTFYGKVRCDQTGEIFDTAHDVEDSPRTYTEVFPDPAEAVEYTISQATDVSLNFCDYPAWKAGTVYARGDIVTYSGSNVYKTYISDIDDNVGNTPNIWGWSEYLPHIHNRYTEGELVYKSLAEWEAES